MTLEVFGTPSRSTGAILCLPDGCRLLFGVCGARCSVGRPHDAAMGRSPRTVRSGAPSFGDGDGRDSQRHQDEQGGGVHWGVDRPCAQRTGEQRSDDDAQLH